MLRPLLVTLTLALASCSSRLRVVAEPAGPELAQARTYAWSPPLAPEDNDGDEALAVEVLRGVDAGLERRGYRLASLPDADLLVHVDMAVTKRVATRNAYNTGFYTADRFEDGELSVTLRDASTKSNVWQATGKQRLRWEAQGYGMYQVTWVPTDEPREWRVPDLLDAIFDELPAAAK